MVRPPMFISVGGLTGMVLVGCLEVHRVAAPESAGREPALPRERLHRLDRHTCSARPVGAQAVGGRREVNSDAPSVLRVPVSAAHLAVVVASRVFAEDPPRWAGVYLVKRRHQAVSNEVMAADVAHRLTIVEYAEAAHVSTDELILVTGLAEPCNDAGVVAGRPWVRCGHERPQVTLTRGGRYIAPDAIRRGADARL